MIIPYRYAMLPVTLYNAFLYTRKQGVYTNEMIPHLVGNNDDDLEKEIKTLFKQNTLNIMKADQLSYNYINSKNYSRSEKINFLWTMQNDYASLANKADYLIGLLVYLQPSEIADAMINEYIQISNPDIKENLLKLITHTIYYNTLQEVQHLTQKQIDGIVLIEKFIEKSPQNLFL